jgi:hypothetical protein
MKPHPQKPFEIQTRVGIDLEELSTWGEHPPRSAKLVAHIDFGSGPGGGDYRMYLLSTDKNRTEWRLWLRYSDYDNGKATFYMIAYGAPFRGNSARYAAEQLLTKVLRDELKIDWVRLECWSVMEAGLLNAEDVDRIAEQLIDEEEAQQSVDSNA